MTISLSVHGCLQSPLNKRLRHGLCVSLITVAFFGTTALAAEIDEVNRLLEKGKLTEAMKVIDASLKRDPKNPRMRFAQGVVLAERKKPQEAIAVFQKLSEDHPDLPEPHNNLAVLYSQDNQFEKARAALNSAIKTNPSYATAYQNLGDVHARIAAQSYSKALNSQTDPNASRSKLRMLAALHIPEAALPAVTVATSETGKPGTSAAAPAVPVVSVPATPSVAPVVQQAPRKPETAVTVAAIDPKASVVAPSAGQMATGKVTAEREVGNAIEAWEQAWETKDMDAYIAAYDQGYYGHGSKNHPQWVNLRKTRILGKDTIDITIENTVIEVAGDTAVARFRQVYTGGSVHSDGLKTLTLRKKTGKWKITKEVATD